jgi:hypothetical protein
MRFEPVAHPLIFVRVTEKELDWFACFRRFGLHNTFVPSGSILPTTEIKDPLSRSMAALAP